MNREVMVKALNVIKDSVINTDFPLTNKLADAIYAIEQALAQPEQEPFKPDWVSYRQGVADGAAQTEQEPDAVKVISKHTDTQSTS